MSSQRTASRIGRLDDEQRDCIDICTEASSIAEWCADECLGDDDMATCARLCRDVADLTALHARLIARDSTYSGALAQVCASACEECSTECSRHDAEHCQIAADVLEACAESCRKMMAV